MYPLLTTNVATRRFIAVVSDTIVEVLKSQQIQAKVLARRFNVLWDILLAYDKETNEIITTADRVHGHPEDQCDVAYGAHVYHGGAIDGGGLLLQLRGD